MKYIKSTADCRPVDMEEDYQQRNTVEHLRRWEEAGLRLFGKLKEASTNLKNCKQK